MNILNKTYWINDPNGVYVGPGKLLHTIQVDPENYCIIIFGTQTISIPESWVSKDSYEVERI